MYTPIAAAGPIDSGSKPAAAQQTANPIRLTIVAPKKLAAYTTGSGRISSRLAPERSQPDELLTGSSYDVEQAHVELHACTPNGPRISRGDLAARALSNVPYI